MSRLKSLYVKDFRSIDGEVNVSLDAPIVLIHGPNGAGKTSILSAIELALTGAVPSLSRAEPDYLAYLPHKDRPFGEVRLELESEGNTRSAQLRVTTDGIAGAPLLNEEETRLFSDRSYLAQSTLGRLLEIYQRADRKEVSPLTKFVKELLGLDRMEAIIAGLNSAGHVSRLREPVPAYWSLREDIPKQEQAIREAEKQETALDASVTSLGEALSASQVAIGSTAQQIEDLPALRKALGDDPDEAGLRELVRLRREVEVSQQTWANTVSADNAAHRERLLQEDYAARTAFEQWMTRSGDAVEALLLRAGQLFADVSITSESRFGERIAALLDRIRPDLERLRKSQAGHEAATARVADLDRQIVEGRTRIERLDQQLQVETAANEELATLLASLTSHIHGENCPVCDRDFTEISSTTLSAHVAAKVSSLVEQAGRLQSLANDRSTSATALGQLERQRTQASAEILPDAELSALKTRIVDLTEVEQQLDGIAPISGEGDGLRSDAANAARALLAFQGAEQSAVSIRAALETAAATLGVDLSRALSYDELRVAVQEIIKAREETLSQRQTARRRALETLDTFEKAKGDLGRQRDLVASARSSLARLTARKAEADQLIEKAKDLARRTKEARGRIVQSVFNDELNSIWRDLFVRLAPEEPFIPAFVVPDSANAEVEAQLETLYRRGGKGGNPRAMLSAGNLNTAALTLFLALHLSVRRQLPLLVIDDPVQSMDEVHIAQFAALLRTLSKQMKRQVIIAVHERSLFDYLTLELSPAFEGDRLNIVELSRNAMGRTICRWDTRLFVADQAIAA